MLYLINRASYQDSTAPSPKQALLHFWVESKKCIFQLIQNHLNNFDHNLIIYIAPKQLHHVCILNKTCFI